MVVYRSAVVGDWQGLSMAGNVLVDVTNLNIVPVPVAFDVVLFEDTDGNGAFDGTDLEYGRATVASMPASSTLTVPVAINGAVRFRDDLLYAVADGDNSVSETDENNNLFHSKYLNNNTKEHTIHFQHINQ